MNIHDAYRNLLCAAVTNGRTPTGASDVANILTSLGVDKQTASDAALKLHRHGQNYIKHQDASLLDPTRDHHSVRLYNAAGRVADLIVEHLARTGN